MFGGSSLNKLPHGVRITVFLLRIVLGASFFYLGYTSLFDPQLGLILEHRSLSGVYAWASSIPAGAWLHPVVQWGFLIIGIALMLGIATRIAAFLGIVMVLAGYLPSVSYTISNVVQFINDELIIIVTLLVLIATKAGEYIGLDAFFHFGIHRKKKER